MYAVITTGGKEYRVKAGDMLHVEKLENAKGSIHLQSGSFSSVKGIQSRSARPPSRAPRWSRKY